ncbi:hypothetical protein GA0111570_103266 [Raineyella antarctica]|uniref:Uncharacterized protein n=1 Tax=Raineyella antarctica TaxID=1577474 RepID=A0A1G6GH55_9ACTN|nr:hypothetical protein [Raineyella antarctica]SDB81362.1 hypothetical protein GA0111570_103266 [Raineyella antarctica]
MANKPSADRPRENARGDNARREDAPQENANRKRTAGLFDIRNMIALLIGIYGLILVFMGFWGDPALDRTGGVNANLWAGIALVVIAAVMATWAKLRPTLVPEGAAAEAGTEEFGHP